MNNVWNEWQANPVTIVQSEKKETIMAIPFPTVAICSEIKTDTKIFHISAALKHLPNVTVREREYQIIIFIWQCQ